MGLWGNFKKILFEDDLEDEELQEMPVYSDKEEVEEPPVENVVPEVQPVVEEPIKMDESSHFTNIKRDIDLSFDESDVLEDIISKSEAKKVEPVTVKQPVLETPVVKSQEEKKSVFLSFDEDEFDRLNSRVNRNEARVRQDIRNNTVPNVEARKANNNFSSTSTSRDNRVDNDKYRISSTPKKSFTPSPIISPVYGILDKNYTKDDIVDKKDGLKREKIIKPVVKKDLTMTIEEAEKELEKETVAVAPVKPVVKEEVSVVDIDMVRKKAFGELEDLEKTFDDLKLPVLNEVKVVEEEPRVLVEEVVPSVDMSVEDELDTNFSVEDIELDEEEKELDKVVEEVIDNREDKPRSKPQLLDDLEKTSTLQILDDIEKELNSIKPISRDVEMEEEVDMRPAKDDTLEKDLFNLIDSMYEEGEEDEDNG